MGDKETDDTPSVLSETDLARLRRVIDRLPYGGGKLPMPDGIRSIDHVVLFLDTMVDVLEDVSREEDAKDKRIRELRNLLSLALDQVDYSYIVWREDARRHPGEYVERHCQEAGDLGLEIRKALDGTES